MSDSTPPVPTPFRSMLLIVGVVLLLVILCYTIEVLLLIFAGILFAIFLSAPSAWLSRFTGLSYRCSLAIVVIVMVSATGLGIWALANSLQQQFSELRQALPQALERLQVELEHSDIGSATLETAQAQSDEPSFGTHVLASATTAVTMTMAGTVSFFLVLILGLFLAIEPDLYRRGILLLVPRHCTSQAAILLDELALTLRWWLAGTLISMTIIGATCGVGLWLLGIPNVLLLSILTALLTFVPNFGPVLSVVLPALLASLQGFRLVLYVILMYLGVQVIESNAVTPLVQRKTVLLPPALLISAQVLMGLLTGVLGMMMASPLTACGLVLVKRLYVEQTLGKEADG